MAKTKKIPLPLIEDPSEATVERASCVACGLHKTAGCKIMPAYVPKGWTGRILAIAEAPGYDEDRKGRPLVGKAGQRLFELLASVGIREEDCALSNANRCWPGPGNPTPSLTQVRLCRPFLAHDVLRLRPSWVLCFGDNAARALFDKNEGVKRHRQRAYNASEFFGLDAQGINVAFTYHPASTFYQQGAEQKQRIIEDLKWLISFKGYIDGPEEVLPLVTDHVGLDIEWEPKYHLLTMGQAVGDRALATEDPELWKKWSEEWSISGLEPTVVGHSIFGDLPVIRLNGLPVGSSWIKGTGARDSLLLSRLENENRGAYDLESLSASISGVEPWKSKSDSLVGKKRDFSTLPYDIRVDRCRRDAWASLKVASQISPKLDQTIVSFTHQLAAALQRVEMAGVKISQDRYQKLGSIILSNLEERREKSRAFAASYGLADFEPTNDDHFRDLLYGRVGAVAERFTAKDKKPSVDHATLVLLYQTGSDAIKEAVLTRLRHEKADKLYSTYIGRPPGHPDGACGLASHLTENSFVFQNINPLGARTGRRSSDNPNMQNWPKRLRAMVVSRYPGGRICKGDESQLEPRILAHVAGIDEWQELFEHGDNLYLYTAKKLWGKVVEKDTPLYRLTKGTVLGTNYGMEALLFIEKMAVEHGIILTLDQGQWLLNAYHSAYPQLPRFFAIQKERLLRDQQVSTLTGQIRHLPCPQGERTPGFKHLWNQAVNFPIQGLAAFVTGSAVLDLETAILDHIGIGLSEHFDRLTQFWGQEKLHFSLDKGGVDSENRGIIEMWNGELDYPLIVNEVHDELVVDTPEKDTKWVMELLSEVMATCPTLRALWPVTKSLKLKADCSQGSSWGD